LSGRGRFTRSKQKVDIGVPGASLRRMEVPLNPDLQVKLSRLAAQQGRPSEALVVEAIERLVNYDEWFLREVNEGLAAADRGELVDHADVRKMIGQRYPG
jgi:predicted transcriptional regulator